MHLQSSSSFPCQAPKGTMADHRRPPLTVAFIPLMSPGHMIPVIDIAILFARRGVATTVITSPGNEPLARPPIDHANTAAPTTNYHPIHLHLLPFPPSVTHLFPSGRENLASLPFSAFDSFMTAVDSFQSPLHQLLLDLRPNCIVSDAMLTATADTATELGIPRLVFYGPGAFPLCVHDILGLHAPHKNSDTFVLDGLAHSIELTRPEMSAIFDYPEVVSSLREAEEKSFGVIVNTFHELEPDYAELYRTRRQAWFVGPAHLSSFGSDGDRDPRFQRLLSWLNKKPAGSVVYVCFGSLCQFGTGELREIAGGLAASGHPYVWVVKDGTDDVTEGFNEGGVIVRGWVPQVAVLGHAAVGGFVTHCGWNSTLEGVTAGVVMATWPLYYEQFVNERFITQVLKVGVRVRRGGGTGAVVAAELAEALGRVMGGGEEADGMRMRAREYAVMARAAVEEGGSSYQDLSRLIEEVSKCRTA